MWAPTNVTLRWISAPTANPSGSGKVNEKGAVSHLEAALFVLTKHPQAREALIKSARAGNERFCSQARFGKGRNTVCTRKEYAASVSQLTLATAALYPHGCAIFPVFQAADWGAKDPLPSRRRFIQRFPSRAYPLKL